MQAHTSAQDEWKHTHACTQFKTKPLQASLVWMCTVRMSRLGPWGNSSWGYFRPLGHRAQGGGVSQVLRNVSWQWIVAITLFWLLGWGEWICFAINPNTRCHPHPGFKCQNSDCRLDSGELWSWRHLLLLIECLRYTTAITGEHNGTFSVGPRLFIIN